MSPVCGCGVLALRAYRRLAAPLRARRHCLFAVSCSHHVECVLRTNGLRPAWQALRDRLAQCRPGYVFVVSPTGPALRCADGSDVPVADLAPGILAEWEAVESCLGGAR